MHRGDLGARFMILNVLKRRRVQELTSGCELYPGQLQLLDSVIQNPGIPQQDAASRLGVSAASVAQSVKRLEKAGLVEKRVDKKNLRRNQLFATESGREAASRYKACFQQVDETLFSGFTDEDMEALAAFLDRMIENVRPDDFDLTKFPFPPGTRNSKGMKE